MKLLKPSDRRPVTERSPHAVVIGAGIGGIAAAIRLGVRGYRVTIVDKLDQAGGRGRVFKQNGFTFDAGPTVITAPFLFEELWTLCGKRMSDDIDMRPVHPFYRIRFSDGDSFDYSGTAEGMRKEVARFSERDVKGYEEFVAMSEKIFRVGFDELAHVPFSTVWDMAKIAPEMIALQSFLTVYQLVAKYISDDRLRQVMSFHPLLVGGNPFSTTSIYTLIAFLERKWGVHFPMGGTGKLISGMVSLLDEVGATLRLNTEIKEILVDDGRAVGVVVNDGEIIPAKIVVSNADSAWTYRHLIRPEYRKTWTDKKVEKSDYSMGLFVWYFGTKKKYPDIAHHTILLGPRYRALLQDIFEDHKLSEDFSLYLHRPTATDPSLAPEGCDAFYVLSPVPHLGSGTDWAHEKERYRKKIERFLSETVMPELEENIAASHVLTPQHFHDEYFAFKGAAFSFEPKLLQSAYFRPHNQSEDVKNLFLVGAGTHPGAGLPGVLSSARVLDSIVPDP